MQIFSTPLGNMAAFFQDGRLASLKFTDEQPYRAIQTVEDSEISGLTKIFLENYFRGKMVNPPPLIPQGTDFQKKIWRLLSGIPVGETISYSQLGRLYCQSHNRERICSRAIGHAVGLNPCMIIIPCHRVIRADGSAGNYAGGMALKKRLLEHEKHFFASQEITSLQITGVRELDADV